nr:MAG TPA: hypothetical protein [Bacteriophage sp.]
MLNPCYKTCKNHDNFQARGNRTYRTHHSPSCNRNRKTLEGVMHGTKVMVKFLTPTKTDGKMT